MKFLKIMMTAFVVMAGFNVNALPITATTGSDFTIYYDSIGGTPASSVDGLSASVNYSNFSFLTLTIGADDYTRMTFDFAVTNTSTDPILTSRVSTLGFSVTPNLYAASSFLTTGSVYEDVFTKANGGDANVPNQGLVEFCFTDTNCAGGAGNGVVKGTTETGVANLFFVGSLTSVDFDKFTSRYQSVECINGYTGNCPGSASGGGDTTTVPEPGIIGLLAIGLLGMGVARRKAKV